MLIGRMLNETALGMRRMGDAALLAWNVMITLYMGTISAAENNALIMLETISRIFLTLKDRELMKASIRRCFREVMAPAKPR